MSEQPQDQQTLLQALRDPARYPHPVTGPEVVETHISTVFLTGDYAYKIKKPVDFGFLDFSTLEKRRHFCEEELRLNTRLAPALYLEVVPITGTPEAPELDGSGEPIEYAVKMRQFDQSQLFDRLLAEDAVDASLMRRVAEILADFHQRAAVAGADTPYGTPEAVFAPMAQNFEQLRGLIDDPERLKQLACLEDWTRRRFDELRPLIERRKAEGHVRECHGDVHLGNIALVDGEVTLFDGIEFNDFFRWGDVISEMAFLTMDLDDRGRHDLSAVVLDTWLGATGDYEGVRLLRFYQVYRAMVRAKVASFRLAQPGLEAHEREAVLASFQSYADLAERYTQPETPKLVLMNGVSGAGKSHVSARLAERMGAVRLRSDVERKRLAGLRPEQSASAEPGTGLYGPGMTERTYARLHEISRWLLNEGLPVIVDATFLTRAQRDHFRDLPVAPVILRVEADEDTLRRHIEERARIGGDPSDADLRVLETQLASEEPPGDDEPCLRMQWDAPLPEALFSRDRRAC